MVIIITVIWLSVKYHNFFSFQNVTSPPHAVNVPFISSHIKVSRSSLEPNLSTWQFYFPCRLFFMVFFFTWSWIQFFFKEILLVIRNVRGWIGFPTSWESVQRIFNQYLSIKRMIHIHFWMQIYPLELNYLFEGVKDVMNTRW